MNKDRPHKYVSLADLQALKERFANTSNGWYFSTTGISADHVWNHEEQRYWVLHEEEDSVCFQCCRILSPDQRKGEVAGGLCAACYAKNCEEVERRWPTDHGDDWKGAGYDL